MTTGAATAIVYPETDGMPLPDGEYQAPIYVRILSTLRVHFQDVSGARVNGDTFIYYIEGDPRRSVSPDCYVVLGLSDEALSSIERNNVYLVWEVGKPPDFILEIGSKSTARVDLSRKRALYAELGVGEYWRFDATGGEFYGESLVGERLVDGEYRRMEMRHESDGRVWRRSEALGLDVWWVEGELRFWDAEAGRWLLNHEEERTGRLLETAEARAEEERASRLTAEVRAETADARAEEERAGRIVAEARLAEIEAELRRLRGE